MNVPIVPEVAPPDMLFDIDSSKCIALRISEEKLNRIRKQRLKQLGLGDSARYANEIRIKEEIKYFEDIVTNWMCSQLMYQIKQLKKQLMMLLT